MSTQAKIRQLSLSHDMLRIKAASVDDMTEAFMKHVQEATIKLAAEGINVGGLRILEAKLDGKMVHFKFEDPDNFTDHIAIHLNQMNPKAEIEVHHTSARS